MDFSYLFYLSVLNVLLLWVMDNQNNQNTTVPVCLRTLTLQSFSLTKETFAATLADQVYQNLFITHHIIYLHIDHQFFFFTIHTIVNDSVLILITQGNSHERMNIILYYTTIAENTRSAFLQKYVVLTHESNLLSSHIKRSLLLC